jgi:beta-xylosidase
MHWEEDWPVIGEDFDGNGVGEPVPGWTKPKVRRSVRKPFLPAASDDFSSAELGLQWQWNHNPVDSAWSLTSHPGKLALTALPAESYELARNTLSQKLMGFKGSCTVCLDLSEMADGQFAGLACMGKENIRAGIYQMNDCKVLFAGPLGTQKYSGDTIWLRVTFDMHANRFQFAWSADGEQYSEIGDPFEAHFGYWKGARVALFSYNTETTAGTALFDDFVYTRFE